jgi:hypothetical protein
MPPKPKSVTYDLILRSDNAEIYDLLNELVGKHHDHLTNARIALAWHRSLKADVDGKLMLGRAKKVSALERELMPFDFVIILNSTFWNDSRTLEVQRRALLDHELCHCEVALDGKTGEPKRDAKDRVVYRMRRHDLEEFRDIVHRHGIWKGDILAFAKALQGKKPQQGLFAGTDDSTEA